MKIIIFSVVTRADEGGGAVSTLTTKKYLEKIGHEVELVNQIEDLKKSFDLNKPDIVLHHNIRNLLEVGALCIKNKVPYIVTINDGVTCLNGTHIQYHDPLEKIGTLCMKCGPLKSMPCAFFDWRHDMPYRIKQTLLNPAKYFLILRRRINVLNKANRIIVIGKTGVDILRNAGICRKIEIIPQPVDDSFLITHGHLKKQGYNKKQIFLPKVDFPCGAHLVFKLFAKEKYKDLTLIATIKEIKNQREMRFFNRYRDCKNIRLLDYVEHQTMKRIYQTSNFIIFPLIQIGLYGRSWAESICSGTPVLGFKGRGSADDYLTHEENAYLVEPSLLSLEQGIDALLNNKQLRQKLSFNGWEFAKKNLIATEVVKKIEAVCLDVVKNH